MPTTHGPCAWPIAAGALFFHAALIAQCPPGATMPRDLSLATTLPESGPTTTRRATGKSALAKGALADARPHLFAALEFHPASADLLLDLVSACGDDPDLLQQWSERYVRAATDARGRLIRITYLVEEGEMQLSFHYDAGDSTIRLQNQSSFRWSKAQAS